MSLCPNIGEVSFDCLTELKYPPDFSVKLLSFSLQLTSNLCNYFETIEMPPLFFIKLSPTNSPIR